MQSVDAAQRAADALGPDYLRWSRLGMGMLGFFGALIGASGPGMIVDAISSGQPPVVLGFAVIVGLLLAVVPPSSRRRPREIHTLPETRSANCAATTTACRASGWGPSPSSYSSRSD
ncbi:hypothetical protein [Microbacterium sp. XT11]|uniref:hypothetical protein n=1 Tax=Microbacterium sp. XT11 TaxID=367477 RepID=UPI00083420E2|nr:hypothetical protein [Microbacterium sp. XT11]